jgi:hypothetical protein
MKKSAKSKRTTKSAKRTEGAVKPADETETTNISAPAAAPQVEKAAVLEAPAPEPITLAAAQPEATSAVLSARSEAARRTAEGKFTKTIFTQIGGKECPRFAPMTWKERDAFMAKPENAVVRERYEKHMASVESKA